MKNFSKFYVEFFWFGLFWFSYTTKSYTEISHARAGEKWVRNKFYRLSKTDQSYSPNSQRLDSYVKISNQYVQSIDNCKMEKPKNSLWHRTVSKFRTSWPFKIHWTMWQSENPLFSTDSSLLSEIILMAFQKWCGLL